MALGQQAVPALSGFRSEEASPELQRTLQRVSESGGAVILELGPLNQEATWRMLESLVPSVTPSGLIEPLWAFTGGNPLFIREVALSLLENGPENLTPKRARALAAPGRG